MPDLFPFPPDDSFVRPVSIEDILARLDEIEAEVARLRREQTKPEE